MTELQLAAELGKSLLDRTQELQNEVVRLESLCTELSLEKELLLKQVEILKNVNESRLRMIEEVDRSLQESERVNEKLRQEGQKHKEQCQLLTKQLKQIETTNEKMKEEMEGRASLIDACGLVRINSVPSLQVENEEKPKRIKRCKSGKDGRSDGLWRKVEDEVGSKLKQMEILATVERNRRRVVEREMNLMAEEHSNTVRKIQKENNQLKDQLYNLPNNKTPTNLRPQSITPRPHSASVRSHPNHFDFSSEFKVDYDFDHLPSSRDRLMRLKNGGSVYGSKESLSSIGLEVDDQATPSAEVCSSILAFDHQNGDLPPSTSHSFNAGCSLDSACLLEELEQQYDALVRKYEALIESKKDKDNKDQSTQDDLGTSKKGKREKLRDKQEKKEAEIYGKLMKNDELQTEQPEYKKLFREIYVLLRKPVNIDL